MVSAVAGGAEPFDIQRARVVAVMPMNRAAFPALLACLWAHQHALAERLPHLVTRTRHSPNSLTFGSIAQKSFKLMLIRGTIACYGDKCCYGDVRKHIPRRSAGAEAGSARVKSLQYEGRAKN